MASTIGEAAAANIVTPSPREKRSRKRKEFFDPGSKSDHEQKVSEIRRKAKMQSIREEKKQCNELANANLILVQQNEYLKKQLYRSQYDLKRLRTAYHGDVGMAIVAACRSAMPSKHMTTRATAVVQAIHDGCLGNEGKWALEIVVRNMMAERYSAEKIAKVVDLTTSLSLQSVTALSRADTTLEPSDTALLPSGSAVKRRQQWLDEYISSKTHLHYRRDGWEEVAQWDIENVLRDVLWDTQVFGCAAHPAFEPVDVAFTYDGAGYANNGKGAVIGALKLVDRRTRNEKGELMFVDGSGKEINTQSTRTMRITTLSSSSETKATYRMEPFSSTFRFLYDVRRRGLPMRGPGKWGWTRPLNVWLMADKVGHQKATGTGGSLHAGGALLPCFLCGISRNDLNRYKTGVKRCETCKELNLDECYCYEIVTDAKAVQYRAELNKVLNNEQQAGRILYLPPRDNDRLLPVHDKQPSPQMMQRIHREDGRDASTWYSRRYLIDEIESYTSGVTIDETVPNNNNVTHLLFDPQSGADKNQQRSLCIMELCNRQIDLPQGQPTDGEIKKAVIDRLRLVERVQYLRRVLNRHDQHRTNPVRPEMCMEDMLHATKNIVAKHLEVLFRLGWKSHAGQKVSDVQGRNAWKVAVQNQVQAIVGGPYEMPIKEGSIGTVTMPKISCFVDIKNSLDNMVPTILGDGKFDQETIVKWVDCVKKMSKMVDLANKPGICTVADANAMQRVANAHRKAWLPLVGEEEGHSNYLHDFWSGHVREQMILTKGLHRFRQDCTEHYMKLTNRKFHNSSNKSGGKVDSEGYIGQIARWSERHWCWIHGHAEKFFSTRVPGERLQRARALVGPGFTRPSVQPVTAMAI